VINDRPNEDVVISEIVEPLETRFPNVPASAMRSSVDQTRKHLARARFEDFVPLLIEWEPKARLERPII
jgi:hypothetical protein